MTITNHIRRIEEVANHVIVFVDAREFEQAHSALDEIATRVRLAHEHVDKLQQVTPRAFEPVSGL